MKHTPYGYDIVDGKAVINEADAEAIRTIYEAYLSGKALVDAATEAGLTMNHTTVKRLLTNKKYLGDGFYPEIISMETALEVEEEIDRRSRRLGRDKRPKKTVKTYQPDKEFTLGKVSKLHDNPIKQVEYAYSLIERAIK